VAQGSQGSATVAQTARGASQPYQQPWRNGMKTLTAQQLQKVNGGSKHVVKKVHVKKVHIKKHG
jgi:bacteriocin-like protein